MPRAGLTARTVTETAAAIADEIGLSQLGMAVVAERLGVKTPSLYKHVGGLADLLHRVALLGATELGDALDTALHERAGVDALRAAAETMRAFVREHPGRYTALNTVAPAGPDDPLQEALDRALLPFGAVLEHYALAADERIHALRLLRSTLHGFVSIDIAAGFRLETGIDESLEWILVFLDRGLRASAGR